MEEKRRGGKILILDDDETLLVMFGNFLRAEGHETVCAADPDRALKELCAGGFDIILLDINMPGLQGSDLYRLLHIFYPAVKVIISSVYPVSEQKVRAPHAAGYYDKSCGADVLLKIIRRLSSAPAAAD